MQMFTRLFITRIVASSRSTSDSRRSTASAEAERRCWKRRTSLCEREKKEVSAPETSAEIHSRQHVTAQSTTTCGVKPLKVIQGRVVSKVGMLG